MVEITGRLIALRSSMSVERNRTKIIRKVEGGEDADSGCRARGTWQYDDQIPKSEQECATLRDTGELSTHVNFNALDAIAVLRRFPSRHVSVEFLVILVPRDGVKLVRF